MPYERILAALSLLLLASNVAYTNDLTAAQPAQNIRVERDEETFVTTITIQATRGEVAWSDVLCGLARARGYDDAALAGLMPDARFSLNGAGWLLTSTTINAMFSPGLQFSVKRGETPAAEPSLVVKADREIILASQRKFTKLFRTRAIRSPSRRYGLSMESGWDDLPVTRNVVIFVHGLESSSKDLQGWQALAKAEGLPCGSFQYPNDQPIGDSADLLADELRKFKRIHPDRKVSLVAHSMGGLVCRAVIEDARRDPGNVRQLIMVATPNHGSNLAYFGFALEAASPIVDRERRRSIDSVLERIEDGLAESSVDLIPDSVFLSKLNRGKRNPHVAYTLFLGNEGLISPGELVAMRAQMAEQGAKNRWVRFFGSRAEKWLADLDEVVQEKGDGVVAVKRGRLQGVEDTVVLRFGHLNVLQTPGKADVPAVHQQIIQRLQKVNR